jgi:16S rRNA G966 N2-methylase RsmD
MGASRRAGTDRPTGCCIRYSVFSILFFAILYSVFFPCYSLTAVIGLIRVARSAGRKQAIDAANPSSTTADKTAKASEADTPYKMLWINWNRISATVYPDR